MEELLTVALFYRIHAAELRRNGDIGCSSHSTVENRDGAEDPENFDRLGIALCAVEGAPTIRRVVPHDRKAAAPRPWFAAGFTDATSNYGLVGGVRAVKFARVKAR
jgi:hypothetical protein